MVKDIFIYGGIGTNSGEVSIANVKSQLDPSASEYVLHIISPGGEVFEGYGIYNILKNTGKKITTHVEGLCASIATLIAFAGDKVVMNKTGEFMIHNPSISDVGGDAYEMRNMADQLDKIKSVLIDVSGARAARNGKQVSKDELWKLYDNETWLTADEAKNLGFVDEVEDAIKAVATVDIKKLNKQMEKTTLEKIVSNFTNLIKSLRFKNQVSDTLSDGRQVVIMDNDGEWKGAQVMLEDGTALTAGEYELASGKEITVDENSVITAIAEDVPVDTAKPETMDLEAKVKDLESQLAAALEANKEASNKVAAAEAKTTTFMNRLDIIEKQFTDLQKAASQTVGDQTPPKVDATFRNGKNERPFDPMAADLGEAYITSRPSSYK
jgi:ATP-dependent protease ClpP protease subunit/uncharacterized coiled-coil protein SlyX